MLFTTKPQTVEATCFNTDDNATMDSIVRFVNQGRRLSELEHAWHNGTDIFFKDNLGRSIPVRLGYWFVRKPDGFVKLYSPKDFVNAFIPVKEGK